jgi:hypothetical protein
VSDKAEDLRRVRFYGVQDLATGWHVARVAELTERFDPRDASMSTMDVLEYYNVQQYLEHGLLPNTYTDEERERATARVPQIRSAVARYFTSIDNVDFAAKTTGIDHAYHGDLLELLGRNKAFERCDAGTALPALKAAGVHLGELLASRELVRAYDREVRELLLASPRAAEHLVRKYLQDDPGADVHLPRSFAPADARGLLEKYIDSDEANPNYLGLIANAREIGGVGIDARLKLRAKRRRDEIVDDLFRENGGFKTGCEVIISDTQEEPVVFEIDDSEGLVARYTYSRSWLEQTCDDNPGILDNFLFLFEFVDRQALLVLPSYPSQLGVLERVMGTTGSTEYKTGAAFRAIDMSSLLQVRLYRDFLESKGLDLERVISWFFQEYLVEEFGAANFTFVPSGAGAYLQRARHLFAEMESVANQYALFARDGELDRDLLTMGSEPVRYKEIPSLLHGKYVCPTDGEEVAAVLHLLFSDQSSLNYISNDLSADNAADLLANNEIRYDDFHDYQKPAVDHLIRLRIIEDKGSRVRLARAEQFRILQALFVTEAASYYHLSDAGRVEADAMVARGWASRRSSLLTDAEGKYFNYVLNGTDFSNGPALRNKYLHGAQANAYGEDAHFYAYLTALRLTVALVIKINDDLALAAGERSRGQDDR